MLESYPIAWVTCSPGPCHIWPIALVGNPGKCGICGTTEFDLANEPEGGKACAAPERT